MEEVINMDSFCLKFLIDTEILGRLQINKLAQMRTRWGTDTLQMSVPPPMSVPFSQPHVYCTVTGDHVPKKALFRLILSTRIKVSSFAVILLVLAHSYILYVPLFVYDQVLRDVL